MTAERVVRTDKDGVCTLTLNRPDKLNAIDTEGFEELEAHIAAIAAAEDTVGCVVLRGAGKAFCAGADLTRITENAKPPIWKPRIIERLGTLRQPLVGAVHGVCYTGGLELALTCDFIIADETARFADTHGKWGLVSAWGLSQRLPRRIGLAPAKRMMMTGCVVPAAEAKAIGLVDLLVPAGELDAALDAFTASIVANSWFSNFETKQQLMETDGMSLAEGLAHAHYAYPGFAPDHQERLARFSKT